MHEHKHSRAAPAFALLAAIIGAPACAGTSPGSGSPNNAGGTPPTNGASSVGHGATAEGAAAEPALPVLRIGTSGDYAPFSKGGEGFDIALAQRMAPELGYRIEWVPFKWPRLADDVGAHAFDIGMSGITWKPDRSVVGWMTRAVGIGGPCVLRTGNSDRGKVAVNRGGILERWARATYAAARIVTVDDNLALPGLLERGEVEAIVTDRFEVVHFAREGWQRECEPPRDRKVYWIAPARAIDLGARVDAWLADNEARIDALREQHFGARAPWTPTDHLIDLLARRLSLMPAVAAYKHAHGLPIEDRAREAVVLEQTLAAAAERGLDAASVEALFREQIELAKAVQRRTPDDAPAMDLTSVLRPALSALGPRILDALVESAADLPALQAAQLDLLVPLLHADERARLLQALRAVRLRDAANPAPPSP
jgi:cyclohexadienyl dehydratase